MNRCILITACWLLLAGCAVTDDYGYTPPVQPATAVVAEPVPAATPAPAPVVAAPVHAPQPVAPPATGKLLTQSHEAYQRHDMVQAVGFAERAQRIDPRNPAIYQWLAELYRDSGDAAQSQQMAQRGLRYVSDPEQRAALEQLAR